METSESSQVSATQEPTAEVKAVEHTGVSLSSTFSMQSMRQSGVAGACLRRRAAAELKHGRMVTAARTADLVLECMLNDSERLKSREREYRDRPPGKI